MAVPLPVGLSTGCFFDRPFDQVLPAIRAAGFDAIEVCSFPAHLDYRDHAAVARAAGLLADHQLRAHSFHAPFADDIDITAISWPARQRAIDEIAKAIDAAAALHVGYFVLHPGPESGSGAREERLTRMENAAAALDDLARRCRDRGLELVLENMLPHLFSGHVRDLLWLLGAMQTHHVGICLDTGHAFLSGDLAHVAHRLSGHLWMVHASDNRGSYDDHLPPGEGHIAWRDLFEQLARTGFSGTVILEIAGQADAQTVLAGAIRARDFLRTIAGEVAGSLIDQPPATAEPPTHPTG